MAPAAGNRDDMFTARSCRVRRVASPPRPPPAIVGDSCGASATLSTPELAPSGSGGMRGNWVAQSWCTTIEELADGTL
jgi:hypothetical protein